MKDATSGAHFKVGVLQALEGRDGGQPIGVPRFELKPSLWRSIGGFKLRY